jgi:hypothetical protein
LIRYAADRIAFCRYCGLSRPGINEAGWQSSNTQAAPLPRKVQTLLGEKHFLHKRAARIVADIVRGGLLGTDACCHSPLALVMDRHTRELLGWQLSRSGKASAASAVLDQMGKGSRAALLLTPRDFNRLGDLLVALVSGGAKPAPMSLP